MKQRGRGRATILGLCVLVTATLAFADAVSHSHRLVSPPDAKSGSRLPLPGQEVLFLGDSWTTGEFVEPRTQGYAYLVTQHFHWRGMIDGGPGTGFQRPYGEVGNFVQRLDQLPQIQPALIIVQGGLNDTLYSIGAEAAAVHEFVMHMTDRFPGVPYVFVGALSPSNSQVALVQKVNAQIASAVGGHFIDPQAQGWFVCASPCTPIDPKNEHPSISGYRLYAERLEASLEKVFGDSVNTPTE